MSDELTNKTQEETENTTENQAGEQSSENTAAPETVVAEETAVQSEPAGEEPVVKAAREIKTFKGERSTKVYTLDELEEASEDYSDEDYNKMVSMYEGTLTSITEKEIVSGRIVSIDDKYVIVDIGFKSEGIVPVNEFKNIEDVKPGDEIEVFLDRVEDREGQLVLSRRKANTLRVWQKIEQVHGSQEVVEGHIKRRIKGGMVVDVFGIDAFLPGSQIDVRPVRDFDAYVGRNMEFLVVKLNMSSENVVVSHRALVETDLEDQRQEILSSMQAGQILEGIVKNITDFGVFIDLGGVDGLLHITDLSWGRVEHPSEICKLDQRLNVVVLEFDEERKRISLGLKQLQPHPWEEINKKYPEGTKVQGKVVSIADYGAFIELEKGVEGLVHISEMSWTQHIKHPSQLVEKNQVIECVILNINVDERKVSLGVKQLENDPWKEITQRYPISSRHKGVVRNLTNFGVFVELEPGIDGLVHISDLSWTDKVNHPSEVVSKGEEIEVSILAVDFDNRRISLGHKQIMENPWVNFASEYQLGSEVDGVVTRLTDKGAFVRLPNRLEGFLPQREVDEPQEMRNNFKPDTEVKLAIVEFDEQSRNITLSEKESTRRDAEKELKKMQKKKEAGEQPTGALTLGEMSGLADLKRQLDDKGDQN
ncbi:MAG: 30S ribosomal protein S1 [Candidatus Cyclonatronum sp.]|uniref:30S ribosomal protein S1 n=1 Tax=Cyclonatronum sp. TaxID=3024185 RepID=UPI0025BB1629|nr:30S ribosomal protein S1 [Cyclonatronum sp.]MCC5933225.1 30S ribosomal protein S1 [Balneolales bacterium]MCH8485875.1 30S ribosomal protein S1 [Cyclonatronum sp.]